MRKLDRIPLAYRATLEEHDRLLPFFSSYCYWDSEHDLVVAYRELAERIVFRLPGGPERTVALRKLLESLDAALRC